MLAASGGAMAFAWVPQPAGRRVRPADLATLIRGDGGLGTDHDGPSPGPGSAQPGASPAWP